MEYAASISRSFYYMHMHERMDGTDAAEYRRLLVLRGERIPVQHLTGEAWFYGYCFRVNGHVLIPRQDTEVLVEEALKRIVPGMRILDLCTGSGCILISILKKSVCDRRRVGYFRRGAGTGGAECEKAGSSCGLGRK